VTGLRGQQALLGFSQDLDRAAGQIDRGVGAKGRPGHRHLLVGQCAVQTQRDLHPEQALTAWVAGWTEQPQQVPLGLPADLGEPELGRDRLARMER
jgi:hypothetical protein